MTRWGSDVEIERRNRIRLAVAAYAYELESTAIMSDGEFDKLALAIRPDMPTGNGKIDFFFSEIFEPHTGVWVYQHPGIAGLKRLYRAHYRKRPSFEDLL
jgi:hypothetical protein